MKPMESLEEVLGEGCRVRHYLREVPHSHEAHHSANSLHLSFAPAMKYVSFFELTKVYGNSSQ